jgi:DNA-directed RNA polymerase specialized sigma subunit
VRAARQAHQAFAAASLDAPLSAGDDPAALADLLGQDDPAVSHATDIEAVRAHLDELPERKQRIMMWRFYGNLTQSRGGGTTPAGSSARTAVPAAAGRRRPPA